ncbi:MAG: EAL domain-containing protein [Campylobacterales bacterium]|nr:EAL domain-containing protein [Campylobacterales bacterium]
MPCRCNTLELIPSEAGYLYFFCDIFEVMRKLERFLAPFAPMPSVHGVIRVALESPRDFFEHQASSFRAHFHPMECERIKLHIHPKGKRFKLESLLFARTLDYYLNVVEDRSFFDILAEQSLTSHFQPIVDVKAQEIVAYEALVRGVKMDGTLMYPGELFEKAARNDQVFMLDRLARESALKTAAVKKLKTKIFINFIPTAIYDPAFCLASTVKWAQQLNFDPAQVVFEVVETHHTADQAHLSRILTYYREQGFRIALDDVGEGYSSLNMLIKLRPDVIKVDRAIIDGIGRDTLKQSIYKGLYTMAKQNGIDVLAEGVEEEEDLLFMLDCGVDLIQGYYFGKPTAEPLRRLQRAWPIQGEKNAQPI